MSSERRRYYTNLHFADGTEKRVPKKDYTETLAVRAAREDQFSPGDHIRLVALAVDPNGYDDRPNLPPGTKGVVQDGFQGEVTDGGGSLMVAWENGSSLNATPDDLVEHLTPRQ